MRIAFLQFEPEYLAPKVNRRAAGRLLSRLFDEEGGADLVVLPELFTSGYFFRSTDDARAASEPVPAGPTTEWLAERAAQTGATLVAGLPERVEDATAVPTLHNSAVVCGPAGFTGVYRKVHLYYEEKLHFAPGSEGFPVFELKARDGISYRLGVMVCFDWVFPESARTLALKGADVIAHPSNLVRPNCPRAMPIRALENHVFTVTANRTGRESNGKEELTFIGQSEICDPNGEILCRAGEREETFEAVEIDPHAARSKQLTAHNDLWADRRPATYTLGPGGSDIGPERRGETAGLVK